MVTINSDTTTVVSGAHEVEGKFLIFPLDLAVLTVDLEVHACARDHSRRTKLGLSFTVLIVVEGRSRARIEALHTPHSARRDVQHMPSPLQHSF